MDAANTAAEQANSSAMLQTGTIWAADNFVLPRVEGYLEDTINTQFGAGSNSSGTTPSGDPLSSQIAPWKQ